MVTTGTFGRGALNGLRTTAMLLKIILPVYVLVSILGETPALGWLSRLFEPVMLLAGLPGGAALAFLTGAAISIYAAMGIILALGLDSYQMTTIAIMLNISHELFVETAVLKKTGIRVWPIVLIRFFGAFAVGIGMNLVRPFLV